MRRQDAFTTAGHVAVTVNDGFMLAGCLITMGSLGDRIYLKRAI